MSERRFSLTLFGPPLVRRHAGQDDPGVELVWRLRRSLQIVSFLALAADRRADKEKLVDAVWHDTGAAAIRRNFHATLSDTRRVLGHSDAILYHQGVYVLHPEIRREVDVERFRALREAGREDRRAEPELAREAWGAAWKLCRGPFLEGWEAPWILALQETLREEYLALLADLGGVAQELGHETQALDAYRSVLIEEPYEEHVHRTVMELYGSQGRRDLVRRQYVRLQEHLKELGVEPLEETQECYHRLMR